MPQLMRGCPSHRGLSFSRSAPWKLPASPKRARESRTPACNASPERTPTCCGRLPPTNPSKVSPRRIRPTTLSKRRGRHCTQAGMPSPGGGSRASPGSQPATTRAAPLHAPRAPHPAQTARPRGWRPAAPPRPRWRMRSASAPLPPGALEARMRRSRARPPPITGRRSRWLTGDPRRSCDLSSAEQHEAAPRNLRRRVQDNLISPHRWASRPGSWTASARSPPASGGSPRATR
mmetsp:Transcript_115961/g.334866  ORF Transcript_115961/g.334866 Transcript_115961/m.334866 type:complete len:233 (+) Transcript_115961:853-1551(+)